MSKNPYFAHLPTWRNRQDLAYALDNLPRILETMSASPPLIATYSYPSTSHPPSVPPSPLSSSVSSSTSSPSSSSSSSSSSSPSSLSIYESPATASSSSSLQSQFGASTPHSTVSSKTSSAAFRERFMLNIAKECQKAQSRSPEPPAQDTPCISRQIDSFSHRSHSASIANTSNCDSDSGNNNSNSSNPYYPLQFSTRAKAMAYLIEILQSLQKEPCGCDLVKGCYCGVDGVEDHEGKSPCYVCGEWFPDHRDSIYGDPAQAQGQEQGQGNQGQRQGRAWHEQGSLRHHVAESRVKKWLDIVFRPPLTPTTSPKQESVRQFGVLSQDDLLKQGRQYHEPIMWNHSSLDYQYQIQQQQQQQQHIEPERPWNFHDIELEARSKSRSRQNSSSSNSLSPWLSSYYSSPQQTLQHQDMTGSGYNYGPNSDSNTWKLTASPKPMYATPPPPMQPSQQLCAPLPCFPSSSQFTPTGVPVISPQPRARTLSFSDSQHDRTFSASSLPFAPPTIRPSSCNGIRRSTPVRSSTHPTTFSIPQEILDPNYKSPTFRIKSWDPPSERSSTLAPLLAEVPKMGSEKTSPLRREVLGRWTDAEARLETVTKSSFLRSSADQHEVGVVATTPKVAQHQKNTCEAAFPCSVSPTEKVSNTPFQFSFTSQRFRAAVEASIEKTTLVADMSSRSSVVAETSSRKDEMDQTLGGIATKNSILQSALSPELKAEKEVKESLSDSTTTLIARVEEVDVVKIDTSAKATITFPSSSSTPISTESQSLPIVVVVEKGTQGQSGNNTMTATAATLASKITDIVLSGSTTPKLGQSEIRKSAPMSSLNPSVSGNGDKPLSSRPSPKFSATPASHMNPTGAGGSSEGGTSKVRSWMSLRGLVRKITRRKDAVMASLRRSKRMHVERS